MTDRAANIRRWILMSSIGASLCIAMILLVFLKNGYANAMRDAEELTRARAVLFSQNLRLVLNHMDTMLVTLGETIDEHMAAQERNEHSDLNWDVSQIVSTAPTIRIIEVVNADGIIVADSRQADSQVGADVTHQPYFSIHFDGLAPDLQVGMPLRSDAQDEWLMPVSRAIFLQDSDEVEYVVIAWITPAYFFSSLHPVKSYSSEYAQLVNTQEGRIVTSLPFDEEEVDRSLTDTRILQAVETSPPAGTLRVTYDGRAYTESYSLSSRWPLAVTHRVAHDEAMAEFRANSTYAALICLVLILIINGTAYYVWRQTHELVEKNQDLQSLNSELQLQITQRRAAEAASHLYRQGVEATDDLLYVVDSQYRYQMVNNTFCQYKQVERDELIGRRVADLMDPAFFDENIRPHFDQCMTGQVVEYDLPFTFAGANQVNLWVKCSPLRNPAGDVTGIVVVLRDVTERVMLEHSYRQAQKMESIGTLAAGIAHDFNNLLMPILGHVKLAAGELPGESKTRQHLRVIADAAQHGATLTRQILAFGRGQTLQVSTLDLDEVVREFASMVQRLLGEDIRVKAVTHSHPARIRADRSQLDQVLMNLAINAKQAMPEGGELKITTTVMNFEPDQSASQVDLREPGEYACILVSDTGCGIDPEIIDRIFEPFFTNRRQGDGTGLGLATVFGIIKQHGGDIQVDSHIGVGTTFTIYLPLQSNPAAILTDTTPPEIRLPHATAIPSSDVEPEPEPAPTTNGNATVLVVEDNRAVRNLIDQMLQMKGFQPITTGDPSEAMRLAQESENGVDLLVTDVIMPQQNGHALSEELRVLYPALKVLFISGYTDDILDKYSVDTDDYRFLQKPFKHEDLIAAVEELLS